MSVLPIKFSGLGSRYSHRSSRIHRRHALHQSLHTSPNKGCFPCPAIHSRTRCVTKRCQSTSSDNNSSSQGSSQFGLRKITGDGACLFRALSQGAKYTSLLDANQPPAFLTPREEDSNSIALRNAICDFLSSNRERFEPFIDTNFDDYVKHMRLPTTFGGEPELSAAADVLKRPISVFAVDHQNKQISIISEYDVGRNSDGAVTSSFPIPLVYSAIRPDVGHYDLLAPISISEEG